MNRLKRWFQDWEMAQFSTRAIGIFSSYLASKIAVLTTTPEYAHFWAGWSLTAPTIIQQDMFEAKLGTMLAIAWTSIDHFLWKFLENQRVTGSPTIQVTKAPPPGSPQNPVAASQRSTDPLPSENT